MTDLRHSNVQQLNMKEADPIVGDTNNSFPSNFDAFEAIFETNKCHLSLEKKTKFFCFSSLDQFTALAPPLIISSLFAE